MEIDVRFHQLPSSAWLREHVERRVEEQLGRFRHELDSIEVHVGDLNGPRGGLDKQVRVTVRGRGLRTASLNAVSDDAYAAVDEAIGRLAEVISRRRERARERATTRRSLRRAG